MEGDKFYECKDKRGLEKWKLLEQWPDICKRLKSSGYDLSKIKITFK